MRERVWGVGMRMEGNGCGYECGGMGCKVGEGVSVERWSECGGVR